MKSFLILAAMILTATTARADGENFDNTPPGSPPPSWTCGVTGNGSFVWKIEADRLAPSKPNILKQSGSGTFPWCVKKAVSISDGFVEIKFKPLAGREDQAGGIVWRWKDGNNYYVARANALENNVALYHTTNGNRITIKYVDAPVAAGQWHLLRVEFSGRSIKVMLDGKQYIEQSDDHIAGAGTIGVWTKADSVTAFDDLVFGASK